MLSFIVNKGIRRRIVVGEPPSVRIHDPRIGTSTLTNVAIVEENKAAINVNANNKD